MKYLEDAAYLALLALLMPLLIVLVWVALIVIITRRTYWMVHGNSTPVGKRPSVAIPAATVDTTPIIVPRPLAAGSTP
jgi:hypothetical protein